MINFDMTQEELMEETLIKYDEVKKIVDSNKMFWDFESIYYTIDKLDLTYDDLQILDGKHKTLHALIMAGLPEDERDIKRVYNVMEQLQRIGLSPRSQHAFLLYHITVTHFFMDTPQMLMMANLAVVQQNQLLQSQQVIYEIFMQNAILDQMIEAIEQNSEEQKTTGSIKLE